MISEQNMRELVIRPTLNYLKMYSEAAENLLVGTYKHESTVGLKSCLIQINGPALGLYQIEPATHLDLWDNWIRHREAIGDLVAGLVEARYIDGDISPLALNNQLITNLVYSTAIARLIYRRVPKPLPRDPMDVPALASYYKRYWNTHKGKASEQDFIDAFYAAA